MDNQTTGQHLYALGDKETREWFAKQWAIWPRRADERLTTNISLHYGGVVAYRIEHDGKNPPMSRSFATNVSVMDRLTSEGEPA